MNYLKELCAFYDYVLYNGVSTGEIALWYALMAINNRLGWLDDFTVSNLILQQATSLSRSGLDSARNALKQRGLISYKTGKANRAGQYQLLSLVCNISDTIGNTIPAPQQATIGHHSSTLPKRKLKRKQRDDSPVAPLEKKMADEIPEQPDLPNRELLKFVDQQLGQMSQSIASDVSFFLGKGMTDGIIRWAVEDSARREKPWVYAKKILLNKLATGILDLSQLKGTNANGTGKQAAGTLGGGISAVDSKWAEGTV